MCSCLPRARNALSGPRPYLFLLQGIELENPSARLGMDLDTKDGTQSYFSQFGGFRCVYAPGLLSCRGAGVPHCRVWTGACISCGAAVLSLGFFKDAVIMYTHVDILQ